MFSLKYRNKQEEYSIKENTCKTMKKAIKNLLAFVAVVGVLCSCNSNAKLPKQEFNQIVKEFQSPADDNSLWCYWYWIGDDISKEGITKDLQAMKKAGIGAAFIGNVNPDEVDGKVPMLSEEWWNCMVHAVNEGKRIGVDIGSFNCPGWSQSGGPWVTADKAMRYLTCSETVVTGGQQVHVKLQKPTDEFQDVYVVAFPKDKKEEIKLDKSNSSIQITPVIQYENSLLDGKTDKGVAFTESKYTITIHAKKAITARSILIYPGKNELKVDCDFQVKRGGKYVSISKFNFDRSNFSVNVGAERYAPVSVSLPDSQANEFRLICSNIKTRKPAGFAEIVISEAPVLDAYIEKHLGKMHPTPQPEWNSYSWKPQSGSKNKFAIAKARVLDISDKMDKHGMLTWDAPEGEWTVLRFGMTPTGTKNAPAAPQGKGYEIDKGNRELIRFHFEQFIGEFLKRIPKESKSAFKYVIADSYEQGSQNWTDGFEQKFEKKYGYNPKKYLPVFSGRIVGSVAESDRFLWDLRRAVADDVAYEYCGGLREIANENGLKLWLENYGHWGFPSEFMMYGGQSDFVSGEYWNEGTLGNIECKAASSTAHIYGKKTTSAECFTAAGRTFVRHPAMLKKRGDWGLTEGINHHVLHVYIHQPDDNRVPGINAWFSTEFNRHNTWFEQGKTYFDYIRRAQHLLQQGKYAADVCYFIGEDAPIMTGATIPSLPKGYSFDYINAEVIKTRLSVKDGTFVLPDGMKYRMMILPPLDTMRPELLAKLEQLVADGGIVYGQAPTASPSLQNYPDCDKQVRLLAFKLWSGEEKIKSYGKGFVVDGLPLQETLDHFNVEKDVDVNENVLWTHRTLNGMEIYFLTNQSGKEIEITPSFRVEGLRPQLWDAVTGEIRKINDFKVENGRTIIPLLMEKDKSWFVVFTNQINEFVGEGYVENSLNYKTVKRLNKPWEIHFENQKSAPRDMRTSELVDWSQSGEDLLKYYSGTANYSTRFEYQKTDEKDVFIDLGKVGVMATVSVNGKNVGTTWMAPYRLKITDAVKSGENRLDVKVVNVWRNRITGDNKLAKEKRTTLILVDQVSPKEALIPSGLMGDVVLQVVE